MLSDLKTGISYVFSRRRISRLLMLYGLFVLLCVPAGFLAGLLVSRVYGDSYGSLTAVELAGFAGMTAGGLAGRVESASVDCSFSTGPVSGTS